MIDESTFDKQLVKGRKLATAGRLADAEAVLRDALTRVRGHGDTNESKACGSLGTFYAIQGRSFEAILLYRRGLDVDRRRGDDALAVRHLANLATVMASVGLESRVGPLFDELAERHRRLGGEVARRTEPLDLWARAQLALGDGDLAYVAELVALLRETWGPIDEPRVQVRLALLAADLSRAQGRPREARGQVERGLETAGISAADGVDLRIRRLGCLEAEGRVAEVLPAALGLLDALGDLLGEPIHAARVIEHGTELGDLLTRYEALDAAHTAYDVAASATLERIRQLDECMRELPELDDVTEEEFAWLRELKATFREQQRDLLHHVADQLERERLRGTSPLHDQEAEDGLVRLCAWCGTVGTPSGRWLPVAHYVPESDVVRATHTICERCAERMRGSA